MTAREKLSTFAEEWGVELIFFEPPEIFDAAILGLVTGFGQELAVLYDEAKVLAAMEQQGLTPDEAREYYDFNTIGAFVGPATPRFLRMGV